MSKVNIKRLIEANSKRSTVYTPLIEAIVNSLEAIDECGREDGEIEVIFYRKQPELPLDDSGALPPITDIEVIDNGIGFNDENTESFDTLHSSQKIDAGGMGYGRTFYLQYFNSVKIESVYKGEDGCFWFRQFDFTSSNFVDNPVVSQVDADDTYSKVSLFNLKEKHAHKLDKTLDTIKRKVLEHLLSYFIREDYVCPKITLRDDSTGEKVTLNDYFEYETEIQKVGDEELKIVSPLDHKDYKFTVKVFKIYFSNSISHVILTASRRAVTKTPLHNFVPEFKGDFFESYKEKDSEVQRNFSVHAYVMGDYLDDNVSLERAGFEFSKDNENIDPLSQHTIEKKIANVVAKFFDADVSARRNKKIQRIRKYVTTEAPWNRPYIDKLDLNKLQLDASDDDIELQFQSVKLAEDKATREQLRSLITSPPDDNTNIEEAVKAISDKLSDIGKSDLVHYVVLRKTVIDLFEKALEWDEQKKYRKEDAVHKIIFPLRSTSDTLPYNKHNLWMIDERLSFHEYLASDTPLNENDERPDILIFDKPILVRGGEELSNPIIVFEFKRPQRNTYQEEDDPIKQIRKYVQKIRSGNFTIRSGRPIKANQQTPAYGFVVCDLTPKIREFCEDAQFTQSPDGEGYFGYHKNYSIYYEIISFDKMLRDSKLRNKILFHKLGML